MSRSPAASNERRAAYRTWLKDRLGSKRLDEIGALDIVALKADLALAKRSAKSANTVLTSLRACLKFAGPDGLKRSEGLGIIKGATKGTVTAPPSAYRARRAHEVTPAMRTQPALLEASGIENVAKRVADEAEVSGGSVEPRFGLPELRGARQCRD